jgi:hypothetical protein
VLLLSLLLLLLFACAALQIEATAKGVKVVETGSDDVSKNLVKMHAAAVSEFVKNGMAEAHEAHAAPKGARADGVRRLCTVGSIGSAVWRLH